MISLRQRHMPRKLNDLPIADYEAELRRMDGEFQRSLALAFQRGDHLSASASDSDSRMADAA